MDLVDVRDMALVDLRPPADPHSPDVAIAIQRNFADEPMNPAAPVISQVHGDARKEASSYRIR
jgi:hypothetical protein